MEYEIIRKSVDPCLMFTHVEECQYSALKETAYHLVEKAGKQVNGSVICLCEGVTLQDCSKIKVYCPITKEKFTFDTSKYKIEVLQRTNVISTVHTGEFNDLEEAYSSLQRYITQEQLTSTKPIRIIYHKEKRKKDRIGFFFKNCKKYVTEVQIPFESA